MNNIIASLCLLLSLSLGYNYIQHLKLNAAEVSEQLHSDAISSLNTQLQDKNKQLGRERSASASILSDTRLSDNSFDSLTSKVIEIDCSPIKGNVNEVSVHTSDKSVDAYYSVLHTAYRLQNKD